MSNNIKDNFPPQTTKISDLISSLETIKQKWGDIDASLVMGTTFTYIHSEDDLQISNVIEPTNQKTKASFIAKIVKIILIIYACFNLLILIPTNIYNSTFHTYTLLPILSNLLVFFLPFFLSQLPLSKGLSQND